MTQATFVFKLRRNITLESDLFLAEKELAALLGASAVACSTQAVIEQFSELSCFAGVGAVDAFTRAHGAQFYVGMSDIATLPDLIRRVSFIQQLYGKVLDTPHSRAVLETTGQVAGKVIAHHAQDGTLFFMAVPHYALIELSDVVARHTDSLATIRDHLNGLLDALLGKNVDARHYDRATRALLAQSTTSHLGHDVHYYKAKFFPRMVRSLLNICSKRLDRPGGRVLDNFAGSGTTLLEASLLGLESVGLDIDPLSVLIAQVKVGLPQMSSDLLSRHAEFAMKTMKNASVEQLPLFRHTRHTQELVFPDWLMKNRRMTAEMADTLKHEIRMVQQAVECATDPAIHDLLRVLLSDAIVRRMRMRFLGTGVGRFSLTFSAAPLDALFMRSLKKTMQVAAMLEWLRATLCISFAPAKVLAADARQVSDALGKFDIVVTSPPYLPASSGRESYTKARTPSLLVLGMVDLREAAALADNAVGSMNGEGMDFSALTEAEAATIHWLTMDSLRTIKAEPTARYFLDMRHALAVLYRMMNPGASGVVVSGKQSTFYRFASREVLHVVPVAEILADEAYRAGFEVEALHDIQLQKANANARPRSLDDYYETLIFLRRPS